jgi:hypothetical protein
MENIMGDGIKGFAMAFGATVGVIIGLYAGFKGIELIGYAQAKREMNREKELEDKLEQARLEGQRSRTTEAADA